MIISSDFSRSSITHPSLLLLLLGYLFSYFKFSRKWLDGFCCNFTDMFSLLLLNCSQYLNKFETDAYRGQLQRKITLNRLIADSKSHLYMNKSRLLCTPVESNFQVLKMLRHFRTFNLGYSGHSLRKGCYRGLFQVRINSSRVVADMK